jgi:hypothetical protein
MVTGLALFDGFRRKLAAGEPFLKRVLADKKMFVIGGNATMRSTPDAQTSKRACAKSSSSGIGRTAG